eukprot:GHVP01014833.1.p1 GENE.GHVP01014833.1~~GHVP01014833.1.p1  ORF type:complete len:817 (+),score=151.79 GHVP01014833.1:1886-4336(+)
MMKNRKQLQLVVTRKKVTEEKSNVEVVVESRGNLVFEKPEIGKPEIEKPEFGKQENILQNEPRRKRSAAPYQNKQNKAPRKKGALEPEESQTKDQAFVVSSYFETTKKEIRSVKQKKNAETSANSYGLLEWLSLAKKQKESKCWWWLPLRERRLVDDALHRLHELNSNILKMWLYSPSTEDNERIDYSIQDELEDDYVNALNIRDNLPFRSLTSTPICSQVEPEERISKTPGAIPENRSNFKSISRLNPTQATTNSDDSQNSAKRFRIIGTGDFLLPQTINSILTSKGYVSVGTLSRADFLVAGRFDGLSLIPLDNNHREIKRARQKNIPIMDELQFIESFIEPEKESIPSLPFYVCCPMAFPRSLSSQNEIEKTTPHKCTDTFGKSPESNFLLPMCYCEDSSSTDHGSYSTNGQLWENVFRPRLLSEIVGHRSLIQPINSFICRRKYFSQSSMANLKSATKTSAKKNSKKLGLKEKSILVIVGPDGVGRTLLIETMLLAHGFRVEVISGADAIEKWIEQTKKVKRAKFFSLAVKEDSGIPQRNSSVIFCDFDNIGALELNFICEQAPNIVIAIIVDENSPLAKRIECGSLNCVDNLRQLFLSKPAGESIALRMHSIAYWLKMDINFSHITRMTRFSKGSFTRCFRQLEMLYVHKKHFPDESGTLDEFIDEPDQPTEAIEEIIFSIDTIRQSPPKNFNQKFSLMSQSTGSGSLNTVVRLHCSTLTASLSKTEQTIANAARFLASFSEADVFLQAAAATHDCTDWVSGTSNSNIAPSSGNSVLGVSTGQNQSNLAPSCWCEIADIIDLVFVGEHLRY